METSGIYEIVNRHNGHAYIGSSSDIPRRWREHKSYLNKGRHINKHLQNAWILYGQAGFIFSIIEECEESLLLTREQYYIDTLSPEYNICVVAGKPRLRASEVNVHYRRKIIAEKTEEILHKAIHCTTCKKVFVPLQFGATNFLCPACTKKECEEPKQYSMIVRCRF